MATCRPNFESVHLAFGKILDAIGLPSVLHPRSHRLQDAGGFLDPASGPHRHPSQLAMVERHEQRTTCSA